MAKSISVVAVLAAALMCLTLGIRGESRLYFPRFSFDTNRLTGVAFVNPSGQPATVTLTAYGTDGTLLSGGDFENPVQVEVPSGQQKARLLRELFKSTLAPDQIGWMLATSPVDGITGFFLYLNTDITRFDGADLPRIGRKITFNQAVEDVNFSTEFNVFNPGDAEATIVLRLFRPSSEVVELQNPLVIPPRGMIRFDIPSLFGLETAPRSSYLVLISSVHIGGFQLVRSNEGDLFGLNARVASETLSSLYFPQLAVLGPWITRLSLVNYQNEAAIVTISAHEADGTLYGAGDLQGNNPVNREIGPQQAIAVNLEDLHGFVGSETLDGWIKVESTSKGINGFVSYGLPDSGSLAAVASQLTPEKRAFFSHIATSLSYFTGVALLNPGSLATAYRISAFTIEGEQLGTFAGLLQPGERVSKLITELIPASAGLVGGFFFVDSDEEIFMTSLFGTTNVLANIPPQPAATSFQPPVDRLTLSPPLAVVPPSGTVQFSASGATEPPIWKVNGVEGGTPDYGSVSVNGLFQAPDSVPDALPVTISVEQSDRIGGGTIDVLRREVLLSGLGSVQAIAYMRSRSRLYSAELQTLSASGEAAQPAQSGTEVTGIFSILPGPRSEVLTLENENVSAMIPFEASNGAEFLLLAGKTSGRIIRLNPDTGEARQVVSGLDAPNALVLDPVSGNLLVAESSQVSTFPRIQLESDLPTPSDASPGSLTTRTGSQINDFGEPVDLAVDACTGNLYISDQFLGLIQVDLRTGERSFLLPELTASGPLLGLYRSDLPCPDSFHLLVSDLGTREILLYIPSRETVLLWRDSVRTFDLALLPADSPFSEAETVLMGEIDSPPEQEVQSQISQVQVPNLYTESPANPAFPPSPIQFSDPIGDTFALSSNQPDIAAVGVFLLEPTTDIATGVTVFLQQENTTPFPANFAIHFTGPLALGEGENSTELLGFIDLDTDQDPLTGVTSVVERFSASSSGLGVDYRIDLSSYDAITETVALYRFVMGDIEEVARIPVRFGLNPSFGGSTVELEIPFSQFDPDGYFDLAVLVGNPIEWTDIAPNGGVLTSGKPVEGN